MTKKAVKKKIKKKAVNVKESPKRQHNIEGWMKQAALNLMTSYHWASGAYKVGWTLRVYEDGSTCLEENYSYKPLKKRKSKTKDI